MRLFFFSLLSLVTSLSSLAQERVRNVRLRVFDSTQLEIRYDLLTARPGDSIYADVQSRVRGPLRMLPQFVRGDVGLRVIAGTDRRIIWNALANGYALNEEIQATVRVKTGLPPNTTTLAASPDSPAQRDPAATTGSAPSPAIPSATGQPSAVQPSAVQPQNRRYAGPAWALLSVVAPGIGNVFVQLPKPKLGLRPLLFIGCYGLAAYGIVERQKSIDNLSLYEQQKSTPAAETYRKLSDDHHSRYLLATRGALIAVATDVVLTFMRGLRNDRLQKEGSRIQSFTIYPGLQAGQPTAVVRYLF
ncbi:hypothetical protein [Spirosoma agri]|uniref:DUF5683 domain-containing protein n=1 Tax=Spirosoma agri TaxID=1987381 RepID=A0A6M0IEQ3_9BACT|nr:hypothetical protein [Spirosoma agri]NEU66749.1 hypothetical protein [Spirosoma agri]